ncbi:MAG: DNA polymerase III subunit epsilon, partial [Halomonas sp.]|nr:DNA polymerase III subunit epsilon [Halomonas sp.]
SAAEHEQADTSNEGLSIQRLALTPGQLRVVRPSDEEQAAHNAKCEAHKLHWFEGVASDA